jgi:hypothetical protein
MYTATITSKTLDKQAQKITLVVEFSDGEQTFTRTLFFSPTTSLENIKYRLKDLAQELDIADANMLAIPTGVIDLSDIEIVSSTTAEVDWHKNYNKLKQVQELIDLGILTGSEQKVVALRNKVTADFRPEYLKLV